MKASELARRFGCHPSTVRKWADTYAQFMSEGALGHNEENRRHFNEEDARIMATVAKLRDVNVGLDEIAARLANGERVSAVPAASHNGHMADAEHAAAKDIDAAMSSYNDVDRLVQELLANTATLYQEIARLQHELGEAQGKLALLEANPPPHTTNTPNPDRIRDLENALAEARHEATTLHNRLAMAQFQGNGRLSPTLLLLLVLIAVGIASVFAAVLVYSVLY